MAKAKRTLEDLQRELVGKRFERKFVATRDQLTIDEENRTIEVAFSSEFAVERWFGKEILDHTPGAVDLTRLNTAGPYLNNHDTDQKIGWVIPGSARIDSDRMGRCLVRYSRRQAAEDEWQDVRDGAPVTISVGYFILSLKLEETDGDEDTYRATWEPIEVSAAPVPADITVGGGRSLGEGSGREGEGAPGQREEVCAEAACAGCEVCGQERGGGAGARAETTTIIEVRTREMADEKKEPTAGELRKQFEEEGAFFKDAHPEAESMAREFYAEGKLPEDFRRAVLEKIRERQKNQQHGKPLVELNEREKQNYSISRAILSAADGESSFEREVSDTLAKEIQSPSKNKNGRRNSIMIPTGVALRGMAMQRTPLTSGGATTGGDIVFTEPGSFIDMLRNRAKVIQLGATVLPGLRGPVAFPKQTGAGTLYWTGENPGADVTESNLALDQVTLSPKTAMAQESYSRQLLAQSNVAADQLVTNDLVRVGALGIDRAALHGTGASNEPTGLYTLSGVNAVAFGGDISFVKAVEMETAIEEDNAEAEMMAYLTTAGVKGKAKTTLKSAGVAGYIWENGEINGYRAESTNQLSKTMLASAATGGTSHGTIFGVWPHLYIGEWGAVELLVDPYTLAGKGLIRVIEFLMVDIAARYAESFAKATGQTVS